MQSPVRVCSDQYIVAVKEYQAPPKANLVGWFAGRVAFFKVTNPDWWANKRRHNRYRYAGVPDDSGNWDISFPEYVYKNGAGHFYGKPEWTSVRIILP